MNDNQLEDVTIIERSTPARPMRGLIGFINIWFTHILSHNMKPQTFAMFVIWFALIVVF